jgi:leucyl/phenylalanyl-tRNA--protein transferase
MSISVLNRILNFPEARQARRDGLVAIGGDLSMERLLLAYRSGVFPWTVDPISWWSPDPRAILELDQLHVSASLKKVLHRDVFEITIDRAFSQVIKSCAARSETWITDEFIQAYICMHNHGHAHSLECWQNGDLAGGIYGVALGGFFAGESMFHRAANASKVALCHLVQHLRERDFALFDIQMLTPVTKQMGGMTISRDQYLDRLKTAVQLRRSF